MTRWTKPLTILAFALALLIPGTALNAGPIQMAQSQEDQGYLPPWQGEDDAPSPDEQVFGTPNEDDAGERGYEPENPGPPSAGSQAYEPPGSGEGYRETPLREPGRYDDPRNDEPLFGDPQPEDPRYDDPRYDEPLFADPRYRDPRYNGERLYGDEGPPPEHFDEDENYTSGEILAAGHRFFGNVTEGLARVVEYAFSRQGYPNGYILGEEAGGAFVAGLRYGEGTLHTKHLGRHPVFWQGPSVGYDFGAEGSKTMILVYDLQHPAELYHRFGGVDGSAYLVGGVGITFQRHGDVVLAPIRSGVGLRLGANIGYLKYTRRPTWNPF